MIVTAAEWSRIASLAGLAPAASPSEVIAALDTRAGTEDAASAAREARSAAIRSCWRCDPSGWQLDPDRAPLDPAIRCDHGAAAQRPSGRDFSGPVHERNEESS
jgi:hypothetical protein